MKNFENIFFLLKTLISQSNLNELSSSFFANIRVGFSRARLQESCKEALNSQAKFWAKITHFCRDFEIWRKISHFCCDFISEWWIIAEISCVWKKFWVRNFVPQEEIYCLRKKFPMTGRNFLWQEEMCCHRKKFPLTGQNFSSKKEIPCHIKKFLLQDDLCCHWTNFLRQEEISFQRKTFPLTGRNFLSQEGISCHRKKMCLKLKCRKSRITSLLVSCRNSRYLGRSFGGWK